MFTQTFLASCQKLRTTGFAWPGSWRRPIQTLVSVLPTGLDLGGRLTGRLLRICVDGQPANGPVPSETTRRMAAQHEEPKDAVSEKRTYRKFGARQKTELCSRR